MTWERDISGEMRQIESKRTDLSQCTYLTTEELAADPVWVHTLRREKQLRDAEDVLRESQNLPSGNYRGDIRSSFAGHAWTRGKR